MKHLPKPLRPRWRYLAVAIESGPDADVDRDGFQRALWYAAQNLLGDPGSAAVDCTVVSFTPDAGRDEGADRDEAIVRVRRGERRRARAAIACVVTVGSDPVRTRVLGTSGTIRACEEKYLGRGSEARSERTVAFEGTERSALVGDDLVDVRTGNGVAGATRLDLE